MKSLEKERLIELDALRGLAALTVVLAHVLQTLPGPPLMDNSTAAAIEVVRSTPFYIATAGHEAVILFFLLSGFVLSLPWLAAARIDYAPYLVRRIFRIYVPYAVAVLFAFGCAGLVYSGKLPSHNEWTNRCWSAPITPGTVGEHLVLLGSFPNANFNPVIWSLVHELRISLIFPFVVLALQRVGWMPCTVIACGLSCVGVISNKLLPGTDYFYTLHYLGFFIMGFLLARHRSEIFQTVKGASRKVRLSLWAMAIVAYGYGRFMKFVFLQDWVIAVGAAVFLMFSLQEGGWQRFLAWRCNRYLGKISYSLYLYHAVILLAIVHVAHQKLPLWLLYICGLAAALLISTIAWRLVEQTSIQGGKALARRVASMRTPIFVEKTTLPEPAVCAPPSQTANL